MKNVVKLNDMQMRSTLGRGTVEAISILLQMLEN